MTLRKGVGGKYVESMREMWKDWILVGEGKGREQREKGEVGEI